MLNGFALETSSGSVSFSQPSDGIESTEVSDSDSRVIGAPRIALRMRVPPTSMHKTRFKSRGPLSDYELCGVAPGHGHRTYQPRPVSEHNQGEFDPCSWQIEARNIAKRPRMEATEEEFGEAQRRYREKTKKLIPFVY